MSKEAGANKAYKIAIVLYQIKKNWGNVLFIILL